MARDDNLDLARSKLLAMYDYARLWAFRIQYFSAHDLAIVLEKSPVEINPYIERLAAEKQIVSVGIDEWVWVGRPLELTTTGRWPNRIGLITRTIDKASRIVRRIETHGRAPAARRWALRALNQLRLPTGRIDYLSEPTYRMRGPRGEDLRTAKQRERAYQRAQTYHEKAKALQERLIALGEPRDSRITLVSKVMFDSKHEWPLPTSRDQLWGPNAYSILLTRFGVPCQMLAASKRRMPWSPRCVFNATIIFEDQPNRPVWHGDTWLFPPVELYESRHGPDPRAGAIELAQTYNTPVILQPEYGGALWIATPKGRIEPTERGWSAASFAGECMEAAGWPGHGDFVDYPLEHQGPAASRSNKLEWPGQWGIREVIENDLR